jgi:glutamate synthase (NADPH) small chain
LGVPAFKMQSEVLERRIAVLKKLGVQFELGVRPGVQPSLAQLRAAFEAVFFGAATGAVKPLDVPGADLKGVQQGLTFIAQRNIGLPLEAHPLEIKDQRVVVLGGGDVAMDCLRTALRRGAREAICLYRRDEAHLPANPADYQEAREEGAHFEFLASPTALLGDGIGRVARVLCRRNVLGEPAPDGRLRPEPVPGTEFEVPADVVLVALGFLPTLFPTDGDLREIALGPSGQALVDANLMTNLPGVFAGGTLVHGPAAFLDAVQDARQAAAAIDKYLTEIRANRVIR